MASSAAFTVALSHALRKEDTYWTSGSMSTNTGEEEYYERKNPNAVSTEKNWVESLEFSTPQVLLFQGLSELTMGISRVKNKN